MTRVLALCVLLHSALCWSAAALADDVAILWGKTITTAMLDKSIANQKSNQEQQVPVKAKRYAALVSELNNTVLDFIGQQIQPTNTSKQFEQQYITKFYPDFANADTVRQTEIVEKAKQAVQQWQVDAWLYAKFGGEVIFVPSNPQTPIEAMREQLEEWLHTGQVQILDSEYQDALLESLSGPYSRVVPSHQVNYSQPWWLGYNGL